MAWEVKSPRLGWEERWADFEIGNEIGGLQ